MERYLLLLLISLILVPLSANAENSDVCGKKIRQIFPDPETLPSAESLHPNILVTDKVLLSVDNVLQAYRLGIFPWEDIGNRGENAGWYVVEKRGILDFSDLHISSSLRRLINKKRYRISFDEAFEDVIKACASVSREDNMAWISEKFIRV